MKNGKKEGLGWRKRGENAMNKNVLRARKTDEQGNRTREEEKEKRIKR